MAYQTGTEASFAALKTTIETFATGNGWTLTSGVLHKGQSNIKLETPTSARVGGENILKISGANSIDFLTEPSTNNRAIYIPAASFPLTYHLFVDTVPDMLTCVIVYESDRVQFLFFGEIVKIDNAAYVGGNMFFATLDDSYPDWIASLRDIDDTQLEVMSSWLTEKLATSSIPFARANNVQDNGHPLVTKIDGKVWAGTLTNTNPSVTLSQTTLSTLFRSPNTSDSQAHLVPLHLMFAMSSSLLGYLGYVEHLRLIRIDNYLLGDIIILGTDKWKVFPCTRKDEALRNGPGNLTGISDYTAGLSGTIGFAVRYDGP